MNDTGSLPLEQTAKRARRFFAALGADREEEAGGRESTAEPSGAPGDADRMRIARRLLASASAKGQALSQAEVEGIAGSLVHDAQRALEVLDGAPDGALGAREAVALEAVIHTRGRPAVKVLGNDLEDIRLYPESDMWALLADRHRKNVMKTVGATAAVHVRDTLLPDWHWVQCTAFMVATCMAMTNRHVLFPPGQGTNLARRVSGTTTARLKGGYEIRLDFAFDEGKPRKAHYRIVDIPFVAEAADPVDAAILKVEPLEGPAPGPLAVADADIFSGDDRMYIVGHPGRMSNIPDEVQAVFGEPNERKRVSFGKLMDPVDAGHAHVVHDASTIGGYSGAAVLGFADSAVQALHYWGDTTAGNRAIAATALRAHATLGAIIKGLASP